MSPAAPEDRSDAGRTLAWYRGFAEVETVGRSAIYGDWARGFAADPELLVLLDELPLPKRQPNLVFGCARLVGAPLAAFAEWREWLLAHWPEVVAEIRQRWTQTNEPLRCAALLPPLALVPGPIALLELGASAGLCLVPDRYSYIWALPGGEHRLDPEGGPSPVVLRARVGAGLPLPDRMPRIVWRAGLDRHPLSAADPGDREWLETLIWPEQRERRERLSAALALAAPLGLDVREGDAADALAALAAEAPPDATLVVQSSAALVYLMPDARARALATVRELGARLLSLEGRGIVPGAAERLPAALQNADQAAFVLALDDEPVAVVDPHGSWIEPVA